jgi:hypothetical protein
LRLARELTEGARSDFAAAGRIQSFLQSEYTYDQTVPASGDPLPDFLFRDREGYCQQFSGAMALMLRMVGIPARVVSGFAPGAAQGGDSFTVNDTDAHSWVEILFPGIGWVTVDPTPSGTPARTNLAASFSDNAAPGAESAAIVFGGGLRRSLDESPGRLPEAGGDGATTSDEAGGSALPFLAVLGLVGAGGGVIARRRRRLRSPGGAVLQLRELADALRAAGREVDSGTTLLGMQAELGQAVGPEGARYAAALRESRYGRRPRRRPGPAERRALRWALARQQGLFGWWRALRAIPLGGPKA